LRLNETIELALTHKFRGIEIDMDEMLARAESRGKPFATQLLKSAAVEAALCRLPIRVGGEDGQFNADIERLPAMLDLAESIGLKRYYLTISPTNPLVSFQQNFETHCQRIGQIADSVQPGWLGLALRAGDAGRRADEYAFIDKAEQLVGMIRMINRPSVGLLLDTWQWSVGGGDLEMVRQVGGARVVGVGLADLPELYDPKAQVVPERLPPGESASSWAVPLLAYLHKSGFDGPVWVAAPIEGGGPMRGETAAQKMSALLEAQLVASGVQAGMAPGVVAASR
jgi:sugar phosphate isomerase/epimerase